MRLLLVLLVACGSPKPAPTKQPAPPAEPKRSTPAPAAPAATSKNPSGCPAAAPNINALCTKPGLECTYSASRCPPVYVCTKQGRFEAQFRGCPR